MNPETLLTVVGYAGIICSLGLALWGWRMARRSIDASTEWMVRGRSEQTKKKGQK